MPSAERGTARAKRFKCDFSNCQYTADRTSYMVRHKRIHTGEKPYVCPICAEAYPQNVSLNTHMIRMHHIGEHLHKCKICKYACAHRSKLIVHMRIHTGEKPHKCPQTDCTYAASASGQLKAHQRSCHSEEKPFKCKLCRFAAKCNAKLTLHMRSHSGEKKYGCTFPGCQYKARQAPHLKVHLRIHTGEKPYKCQLCDYASSVSTSLAVHVKGVHDQIKDKQCPFCPYSSYQYSKVVQHMRAHTNERPFKCDHPGCTYEAVTIGHLKNHRCIHSHESKKYECRQCGRKFSQLRYLRSHVQRIHVGLTKRLSCKFCDLTFSKNQELIFHTRRHTGDKPFKCDIEGCGYSSVVSHDLKKHHIRRHTTDKPYSCHLCPYKSNDPTNLYHHLQLHGKPRGVVKCSGCSGHFGSRDSLNSHRKLRGCPVNTKARKMIPSQETVFCSQTSCKYFTKNLVELAKHLQNQHQLPIVLVPKLVS